MTGGRMLGLALQLAVLALGLFLLMVLATGMGYISIPFTDVLRVFGGRLLGCSEWLNGLGELVPVVIFDVRLPRILTAAAVGAGLAVSGVVFQGILLNPLADPYTLGVSAGAALGASVALLFDFSWFGPYSIAVLAFAGALATLFLVIYLAASGGGLSSNNLILSGVIVTAILSAAISFMKYLAQEKVAVIIFWLLGSFTSSNWPQLWLTLALLAVCTACFLFFARDLNLICLGGRVAASLGVETERVRLFLLITASLMAAVCVSVSGIIGFVGLLVPHIMRSLTGPDHQRLLPVALLAGAILLLGADTITRALLPSEVPIGVLTALIGGPFFCFIFRHRQRIG